MNRITGWPSALRGESEADRQIRRPASFKSKMRESVRQGSEFYRSMVDTYMAMFPDQARQIAAHAEAYIVHSGGLFGRRP